MRSRVRSSVAAVLFLAVQAAATWVVLPAAAQSRATTPEIGALQVDANRALAPGSTLNFTVRATPRGQVRVQVQGTSVSLALREDAPGVYKGSYTVRAADRINAKQMIRASLVAQSQTAVANFRFPPAYMAVATQAVQPQPQPQVRAQPPSQPQPQARAQPPSQTQTRAQPQVLRIDRFIAAPADRLEPGTELRFSLNGAPGATASFELPGIAGDVPMREVQPGQYVGSYTLRRQDKLDSGPVVATLRSGERWTTAKLAQPLAVESASPAAGTPPPRQPVENSAAGTTVVFGTFDDGVGSGKPVDPSSVRLTIAGRDVTAESRITPQSFSYRGALPPGSHTVEVSARDTTGNTTQNAWVIDVAPATSAAAARAAGTVSAAARAPVMSAVTVPGSTLPLQVMGPGGAGPTRGSEVVIEGRTAPGASVRVQVDAIPPSGGERTSVAQLVSQQTVTADPAGNFSVNLGSYRAVMGTRFEVSLVARQGSLSAEQRLVLAPRPG